MLFVLRLIGSLLLLVQIAGCDSSAIEVEVANSSGTRIEKVQIGLCGDDYEVAGLEVGEVKAISVEVHCESHFSVSVMTKDGSTIAQDIGYVTPGLPMDNRIAIHRTSIDFEARPPR